MKNLDKIVAQCKAECDALGIQYGDISEVTINTRAKKRWGQTRGYHYGNHSIFTISISDRLLEDNVDDMATKNTVMHEILHTVEGCQNHGNKWKAMADKVNKTYGYNVKRCTSSEEKGIEPVAKSSRMYSKNYVLVCKKCGAEIVKHRMSNFVQYPNTFRHVNCGGTFMRIQ